MTDIQQHPVGGFNYFPFDERRPITGVRGLRAGDVVEDDEVVMVVALVVEDENYLNSKTWWPRTDGDANQSSETWELSDPDNWYHVGCTYLPSKTTNETRVTSETGGSKGTKPEQYDQFPVEAIRTVAEVYAFGAAKYEAHNFRRGYKWSLSFSALCRHLWAFWGGEDNDPESGLPHMGHVAWHALALMSFQREHPEYDDRYRPEATP